MRKKKHNADEIRFCQSRLHRMVREFKNGETAYLVSVDWDNGQPMRLAVCKDCYAHNVGPIIKEIVVENARVPVMA